MRRNLMLPIADGHSSCHSEILKTLLNGSDLPMRFEWDDISNSNIRNALLICIHILLESLPCDIHQTSRMLLAEF